MKLKGISKKLIIFKSEIMETVTKKFGKTIIYVIINSLLTLTKSKTRLLQIPTNVPLQLPLQKFHISKFLNFSITPTHALNIPRH